MDTGDGHAPRALSAPHQSTPAGEGPFRTLVEAGADAVLVVCARHGTVRYANPAAGTLLGQPPASLVGQPFGVPVVVGETTEVDLRRADGAERVAQMRAVEIAWLGEPAYLASLRDATDRKRAEDAAREASVTLQSFYDTASLMMGVAELVGDDVYFVSANAATTRFFGDPPGGLVGKTAGQLGSAEDTLKVWIDAVREAVRTKAPVRIAYERATPGGPAWLAATIGFIGRRPNGRPQFSFVVEDVTEEKRAAAAIREASRRKDEFLAMLAHELRNPLAPVKNAVEILRRQFQADGAGRSPLDMMDRQVQHMARLLDDLLDVSRVTHGTIRLQKEPLDVSAVVARAVETSRPHIDARRHQFTVEAEPGPHLVEGDLARLVQVVSNLLNNAAKYTPDGGQIALSVRRDGHNVVVRVKDNGTGIQPDLLPSLFDTFTQGTRTLARSEGGLGLGLALVKSLTELHGGTVHAASAGPGHGAEFEVRLPLIPQGAREGRRDKPRGADGGAPPLKVLVVDDNRDAADSLALLLEMGGHAVTVAYDGPSALDAARAARPDLVFLDIGLPGMDGYAVAGALRSGPETKTARVVALSGYGQAEDRERGRRAGFDDHLVKPVDGESLARCLSDAGAVTPPRA